MASGEILKRHYAETLMEMCEEMRLVDIGVADVTARAGTARQTLYNHFSDINDLICYAATLPWYSGRKPFYSREHAREAWEWATRYKAFFSQLHTHTGQNSFREVFTRWQREFDAGLYLDESLNDDERAFRVLSIQGYTAAYTEVFLSWCASGMKEPIDAVMRAIDGLAPSFMTPSDLPDRPERPR